MSKIEELPQGGGSFIRHKNGSLKPVEQTDEAGAKLRKGDVEHTSNEAAPKQDEGK